MVEKEDIEELNFSTEEEYRKFLEEKLQALQKDGEYVIFMHEICEYAYGDDKDTVENKKRNILARGLRFSRYGSIVGTTKMIGEVGTLSIDDIINYSYYKERSGVRTSLILAFPKYITINGEKVEFVTYKGTTTRDGDPKIIAELKDLYAKGAKYGAVPSEGEDMKYCMLDIAVKYGDLPTIYNLGIQEVDLDRGTFAFLSQGEHYSQKGAEYRKEFDESLEQACLAEIESLGANNFHDLLIKSWDRFFAENSKFDDFD